MSLVPAHQLGAVDMPFGWLTARPMSNDDGYWLTLPTRSAANHAFMMFLCINVTSLATFLLMLV